MGRWGLPLALLGWVSVEAKTSRADFFANNTKIIDHCFFVDRRYSTPQALKFFAEDYQSCQRRCQNTTNCAYFGYWKESSACYLGGQDAVFTDFLAKGGISGPKFCPHPPSACVEVPGSSFPGPDAEESKKAWPSHRVPEKLECWPKNTSGGFYDSCSDITVLEDVNHGWPGLCQGTKKVLVPWGESCESYCRKKVSCSVYQVMNDTGKSCYHSKFYGGSQCYMRTSDSWVTTPLQAKRIMHGRVRVLKETTGVQVLGLKQAFDENYFLNVSRDAVPACRNNCYSNIGCQWWQYSRVSGCWVEDPRNPVVWPMTKEYWRTDGEFASTVIGGEYIQHVCPGKAGLPANFGNSVAGLPTTPPSTSAPPGPVIPEKPSTERSGTLQGALVIHGLYCGTLTQAQQSTLGENCTAAISKAIGINPAWVKNEDGMPQQVTLGSVVDGTRVGFLVDRPQGMTSNDVSRALLQHTFIDEVKGTAQRLLGSSHGEGTPVVKAVEVHSIVMETTPRPVIPSPPPTTHMPVVVPEPGVLPASPVNPQRDDHDGGLSWWFLALLVPVALLLCFGGCAYFYTQHRLAKQSEQNRERKHHKTPKSPPKGKRYDDEPLLESSRTTSQTSSREQWNDTSMTSMPPPSPYVNLKDASQDAQSVPLLSSSGDLPPYEANRGREPSPGGFTQNELRTSVLNAAFDIIDTNHDGLITASELRQFEEPRWDDPRATIQSPALVPTIRQSSLQPPAPLIPNGLRTPGSGSLRTTFPPMPIPGMPPASPTPSVTTLQQPVTMPPIVAGRPSLVTASRSARSLTRPSVSQVPVQAGPTIKGGPYTFKR